MNDSDLVTDNQKLLIAIEGCLIGTAIGDAVGLPFEGISRQRIGRLMRQPLQHQFILGYGMVSDDTEHSCMVAQSLIQSAGEPQQFSRQLARRFKMWLLALPAGIGMATLKAILRLLIGFTPKSSGVFSAGNGPMMRSAIIGLFCDDDEQHFNALTALNTQITHIDPKAVLSAGIVARAAYLNSQHCVVTTDNFRDYFQAWFGQTPELDNILNQVLVSVKNNATTLQFCQQQGMSKAVSGYCYHTLPVVLHIYLTHQNDFEQAISQSVQCGGDTDTIAAIVGGIIGARVGKSGIPKRWLQGLKDWPCLPGALSDLAQQLARVKLTGQPERAAYFFFPMVLIRNLLFMVLVLAHGFRRLLPPY